MFHDSRFIVLGLLLVAPVLGADPVPPVHVARVPEHGIQPQVARGDDGAIHLIYLAGEPGAADLYYARRGSTEPEFAPAIRVNSQPGSAVAIGTIRGGQIALGRTGDGPEQVHLVWNGSGRALPKGPLDHAASNPENGAPVLYARLDGAAHAFTEQRNLMTTTIGLDGGAALAADRAGRVVVAWHGAPADATERSEAARRVFLARSSDGGATFAPEAPATDLATGACACCGMRGLADSRGTFWFLYRAAVRSVDRDLYLLRSDDGAATFRAAQVHPWNINACPMTTAAIAEFPTAPTGSVPGDDRAEPASNVVLAWETRKQVYFAIFDCAAGKLSAPVAPPGSGVSRSHPALAGNVRHQVIFAWCEGLAWGKGGSIAWQVYDATGSPIEGTSGHADGLPVWSLVAAFADDSGGFTVLY